jgi:xanthine dehydrogenase molybdopterin-binding subunit B
MKGNALYYQHVRRKLAELKDDNLSKEAYREYGGVSGTGVIVALLLLFAYAGISTAIFGF